MGQKSTVYLETSIVSYYTSRPSRDLVIAARQELTRERWLAHRPHFEVYISALVLNEAKGGDTSAAQKRLEALEETPLLEVKEEAVALARILVERGPIPSQSFEDALHIAISAAHGMDYLLTWNFSHIANAQMRAGVIAVVQEEGYQCPTICTPEELMEDMS